MSRARRGLPTVAAFVGAVTFLAVLAADTDQQPNTLAVRSEIIKTADQLIFEWLYAPDLWRSRRSSSDLETRLTAVSRANQLLQGARSTIPELRRAFLRALGRLETPADVAAIASLLRDPADEVRTEAANALAQVLHDPDSDGYTKWAVIAADALRAAITAEDDAEAQGMMLRALGEIRHDAARAARELKLLIQAAQVVLPVPRGFAARQAGALDGLEALVRHMPSVSIDADTRRAIRKLAAPSFGFRDDTGPFLQALQALVILRDDDLSTALAAATFRCSQAPRWSAEANRPDCGWEIRRLGLQLMPGVEPSLASAVRLASRDPSFRVRMEAMRVYARDVPGTRVCQPVTDFLSDVSLFVVIDALEKLHEKCFDRDVVVDRIAQIAEDLADPLKAATWHVPAAALGALARFDPVAAKKLATEHAVVHPAWQVRAAAARVAALLEDEVLALLLAYDDEPNVRTEALSVLYRLKSSAAGIVAIDALQPSRNYRPDSQVVYTAALVLRESPAGAAAVTSLVKRLTPSAGARETRLEIIKRLSEFAQPDETLIARLNNILNPPPDVVKEPSAEVSDEPSTANVHDPLVQRALADLIEKLGGPRPEVVMSSGGLGLAQRDSCDYLETEMISARIGIRVNAADAPVSASRFAKLVSDRAYDGTTFHRVFPNNYIQGGSPRGNDYSDHDDEVGMIRDYPAYNAAVRLEASPQRHTRGSVAIMHRERHAAHMQLFINLVDSPHLNRDFIVLGQIGRCQQTDPAPDVMMDSVDRLMEGAKIVRIYAYDRLR